MRLIELHPVLELALRRQSQGLGFYLLRSVTAGLSGMLLLSVVLRSGAVPAEELRVLGARMFTTVSLISAVVVFFVVPALAVGPFVRARETGMLDALVLTGCSEWQIVRAFWWSAMTATGLTLASMTPFLILTAIVGGISLPDILALTIGALVCAGVLTALALAFGVAGSSAASSGQALFVFALGAGMIAFIVPLFLQVVLPAIAIVPSWVQQDGLAAMVLACLGLLAMELTLLQAGRRLRAVGRMESSDTPYSLAVAASPGALRWTISDPALHVIARHAGRPRSVATACAIALLLFVLPILTQWSVRLALLAPAAALVAMAVGAWVAARVTEALAGGFRKQDLALAGQDPTLLKRRIVRSAASASVWPLLSASGLYLAAAAAGQLEIRAALLAAVLVPGAWLACVGLAMRLVLASREPAPSAALATVLVLSFLMGGGIWVYVMSGAASTWRLAHPFTLLLLLSGMGLSYWAWAGPAVLATVGWCLVGLHLNELAAERLRQGFREPARSGR